MKKLSLYASFSLTVIFVALLFLEESVKSNFCGARDLACWRYYNLLLTVLLLSPALLISSLVARRVPDEVFSKWKTITLYFIAAYLLIVILMPWSVGDEIAGFSKGMVALVLCVGYALFSCIYLLTKKNHNV